MKVKCIKEFSLAGQLYVKNEQYDLPAAQATDYAEYFEKSAPKPKTKKQKTQENK